MISIAFVNCAVVHNVKVSWLPPNTTKAPEVTSESTTKFIKIEEKSELNSTSVLNEKSSTSLPQRIAGQFLVRMINEIQEKHRQQAFKRGKKITILAFRICNFVSEVAAMESTPKEEADESLLGKAYGFLKNVGRKIKNAFQSVWEWFG